MIKKIKFFSKAISEKGFLESCIYGTKILLTKICSAIKIFFFRLRGYKIDYSVVLRGNNFFFESKKGAVNISKNSTIGNHTRISAGENGRIFIGKNVLVDNFTFIMSHGKIEIGDNTKLAAFCFIIDFNHEFGSKVKNLVDQGYKKKEIRIGSNVWIGTHSIVLPGVSIGDRVVIGAGSVVTKNIPADSVAVGNPAKVIRKIK